MKEKNTIAIICFFLIGMYWISRYSSMDSSNVSFISEETVSTLSEDITMDFIDYDLPETALFDVSKLKRENSDKNNCTLISTETDLLTFGEAFAYYRQCLGAKNRFQWKGTEYTTLISEEIIIQVVDTVKIDDHAEESEVSQIR